MAFRDKTAERAYRKKYYREKIKPERERKHVDADRRMVVSVRLRTSLIARVSRLLHEGIATGSLPYKTPSEIYGDLIFRGMETFEGNEVVDQALQYLRAVSATDSIGAHRREAQAAFSRVKTEISELLGIKAVDAARRYYWMTVISFQEMDPHEWRDWFLDQMERTFPELAKEKPKPTPIVDTRTTKQL